MMEQYLILILISMLPWIELRGSIPIGIIVYGLNPLVVFAIAVTANSLIYFPGRFALGLFYRYVENIGTVKNIVERVRKKSTKKIEKYEFLGLTLLVAVPLPFTGAYTGTLAAWLLNMDYRKSFVYILAGILIAGIVMTGLSMIMGGVIFDVLKIPKSF